MVTMPTYERKIEEIQYAPCVALSNFSPDVLPVIGGKPKLGPVLFFELGHVVEKMA